MVEILTLHKPIKILTLHLDILNFKTSSLNLTLKLIHMNRS